MSSPMTSRRQALCDAIYPPDLRLAEIECIATRRARAARPTDPPFASGDIPDRLPDDTVGLALSGGGIRSATFCLGVLQALAAGGLVRRLDFLSTVSGGGYVGGFLGALIDRAEPFEQGGATGVDRAECELTDPASPSMKWLREHGRYMSPNGAGDELVAGAVFVRNWFAIHIVMATMVLAVMGMAVALRTVRADLWVHRSDFWWSPYLAIAAGVLLVVSFPIGWGYWFVQRDKRISRTLSDRLGWTTALGVLVTCLVVAWWSVPSGSGPGALRWSSTGVLFRAALFFALTSSLALVFWRLAVWHASRQVAVEKERNCRSRLSQWLADSMVVAFAIAAFGIVDSLGLTMYAALTSGSLFKAAMTGGSLVGVLGAAIPAVTKLVPVLTRDSAHGRISLPRSVIAGIVAVLVLGAILVGLSTATYAIGFAGHSPATGIPDHLRERLMWLMVGASILSILFGLTLKFVNNSSHQALYGARLTRAYLGASNKRRYDDKDARKVSDPVEGDDIGWGQYAPFRNGGPLHIVNVTLNETISGESQVEQRDRRGIPMAIGPCGLSGSKRSHALFKQESDPPAGADPHSRRARLPQGASDWIKPLDAESDEFDMFFGSPPAEHRVEALNVGTWVAISGAAFTTGLGAQTSLSLSLLLGIANVRLGYWWDSHVDPWARNPVRAKPGLAKRVGEVVNAVFPVQTHLVQEFTARFFGPHRRRWYLSDGGHFENTACYELIRRRVPFIIACDNGQDDGYTFEDVANLVRKVRIDFCAEVRFFTREELNEHVDPSLQDVIGTLDDFRMQVWTADERGLRREFCQAHALLAWVYYEVGPEQGGQPGSVILFVKPSITGDEPLDVLQYRHRNPAFPNESTVDQFFDEAQWESYRKLGAHIGHVLFGRPGTGAAWRPALMRAPLRKVERRTHAERAQPAVP